MKQKPAFTYTTTIVPPGVDPRAYLEQAMADCPECQAAIARGEQPTVHSVERRAMPQVPPGFAELLDEPVDPNESRQVRRARQRRLARMLRPR